MSRDQPLPLIANVGSSALAPAMAAMLTNPADVAKTRLNMDCELQPPTARPRYAGVSDCLRTIYRTEGVQGLQRGLGFALVRESSKNAFRLGLYEPVVSALDSMRNNSDPHRHSAVVVPMSTHVTAGAFTGAFAALICNPLDLLKTRLQVAVSDIGAATSARELLLAEGPWTLWRRGVVANMGRSALGTSVALPVNARLKEWCAPVPLLSRHPTLRDTVCALASAMATTLVINPVDLVRTRLYAQQRQVACAGSGTTLLYRSAGHCAWRVATTEGLLAFWKGCGALFLRIGPHQTLTFVFIGALRRVARKWKYA